ncbi:hypothetical protein D3C78_1652480 [compost metagenome]
MNITYTIMHKENLPASVNLKFNSILDNLFIENMKFCNYRLPVRRRSAYDG